MYNLFLDDIRKPENAFTYTQNENYNDLNWIVVRSYDEFVKYIKLNGLPKICSFDHDLSDQHYNYLAENFDVNYDVYKEKTGYECVKWLCDYCMNNNEKLPECMYHTQNIIGHLNMSKYVENFEKFHK